jgi:hypothetical protein
MRCGIADEPSIDFRCLKAKEGIQQRAACLPARYAGRVLVNAFNSAACLRRGGNPPILKLN